MAEDEEQVAATEDEPQDLTEQVEALLESGDLGEAAGLVSGLRPGEAAYVLEQLDPGDSARVVSALDPEIVRSAIEFVDPSARSELVRSLDPETLAETLAVIPDDLATDVVQDLDVDVASQVLGALPDARRRELEQLLTYPEDTAGGRMTGQLITVRPELTASQTIEFLRASQADATRPFYLYVTAPDRTLLGVLNLRSLITAPATAQVTTLMTPDVISVPATMDQEEAARLLQRHNLLSLPVVDDHHHLLGTVTGDDLIDVLDQEATEDIYRMAGVSESETLRGVMSSVRNRLPWLVVNLVTALAAAWVVSRFENTLEQAAILAAFLPVIGGQGGNAGVQTLTVIVRSLALGRISVRDTVELIWHEFRVGILLGAATGAMVGVIAYAWRGNAWLGVIVTFALLVNITVGALAGVLIPMALQRLRQDPALSGGIWVTTATDLSGFFAFLLTATFLIEHLRPGP